jgi:hypothetical protein
MAEAKTKPTQQSFEKFVETITGPQTREDCLAISKLMREATGSEPQMWGSSIVGFGKRIIKYAGGREGEWPIIAFSPRKQDLTLYVGAGLHDAELLKKLGKHTLGKGCLYFKRLSDVNLPALKRIIKTAAKGKS